MNTQSIGCVTLAIGLLAQSCPAQTADEPAAPRQGFLVDVPLPILGDRDEVVQRQIAQIASQARADQPRPVVVLSFSETSKTAGQAPVEGSHEIGQGTQFERALALARFLTSPSASKVRLIAYVQKSVVGHAVLPILACEEISAASDAEIGRAAVDEPSLDETVRNAYVDIAKRRGTLSEAVVQSMLDSQVSVLRVETTDGSTQIVTEVQAAQLRKEGRVLREESLWSGGSMATYSGTKMRQYRWIAHLADSPQSLAPTLSVVGNLKKVYLAPDAWRPILIELSGDISDSQVGQIMRALDEQIDSKKLNLIVTRVKQGRMEMADALQLANYLARLEGDKVRTVGMIVESTSSPAALAAFASDEVYLVNGASIGNTAGALAGKLVEESVATQETLMELEVLTNRPTGLMAAAVDSGVAVKEYIQQQTGQRRIMPLWQLNKLSDRDQWLAKDTPISDGQIPVDLALKYDLLTGAEADEQTTLRRIGINEELETLSMPWLDSAVQNIVAQRWLPRILLLVAFLAISVELGTPGLGAGGFVAGLCFLGFFWIETLNGNVEWLEILLFIGGLFALAIEAFVLPGFGLFGIGGFVMLLASVVLASQTFIVPTNSEQLSIVAHNFFWVSVSAFAVMIGLLFMRKQIEASPMVRWITVDPAGWEDPDGLAHRESVVHWDHLLGQEGLTTTRLNPSGKAQFGREIVNVLGSGQLIDEGELVRVIEVRGNSVVVERIDV